MPRVDAEARRDYERERCRRSVRKAYMKDYRERIRNTPEGAFKVQRDNARRRGVEWKLTFEQWWDFWYDYFHNRGRKADQYCMARYGDEGPYAEDNVAIVTNSENRKGVI